VLRVRGLVRELLGSLNFSLDQRRGRGRRGKGLTGEEDDDGASRIVLGEGEERDGRGGCEEEGARGEPFIGARGKGAVELLGSGELHNAAHKCRTAPPRGHHGGAVPARTLVKGRGGRSGAKLPCAARRRRGGWRRWPEVTAVKGRRKDDEAADKRGRTARGSERARGRAADGWGRFASEREGERRAGWRARGSRLKLGRGERERGFAGRCGCGFGPGNGPAGEGGGVFLFSFLFSNSFIHFFISFSFEQLIDNLRC
jgi:hypothetical protein